MNKKLISLSFVCALILGSCAKESAFHPEEAAFVNVVNEETALKNFSIALSKAVCSEQSVREFLKKESLKQVDNDYDVFYPFVKNLSVDESRTFRDVISQYLGGGDVDAIEKAVPTLTILVPDMTWLDPDGFCAEHWDTSDQRASVTYKKPGSERKTLFVNGYDMGEVESGSIPGGTVLVVKYNERIVADIATKGAEPTFRFIDDVFDASKNEPMTKNIRYTGKYSFGWLAGQPEGVSSDVMSVDMLNKINPDIITAYKIFKDDKFACHNDYIYYGMTSDASKGKLRTDVVPKLIRFKINPDSFDALFDDPYEDTKDIYDVYERDDNGGKNPEPSLDEIYDVLWANGALEIEVDVYCGDSNERIGLYDRKF